MVSPPTSQTPQPPASLLQITDKLYCYNDLRRSPCSTIRMTLNCLQNLGSGNEGTGGAWPQIRNYYIAARLPLCTALCLRLCIHAVPTIHTAAEPHR